MNGQEDLIKKLVQQDISTLGTTGIGDVDAQIKQLVESDIMGIQPTDRPGETTEFLPKPQEPTEDQRTMFLNQFMKDPSILDEYIKDDIDYATKIKSFGGPPVGEPPKGTYITAGGEKMPAISDLPEYEYYEQEARKPPAGQRILDVAKAGLTGEIDIVGTALGGAFRLLGNLPGVPRDLPEQLEAISGGQVDAQKVRAMERDYIASHLGYYPEEEVEAIRAGGHIGAELGVLSKILRGAGVVASKATNIPALKALARAEITGTVWGMAHKPEDDSFWNRLKQIPGDVAFFALMEGGFLTAQQAWKMYKWGKVHGGKAAAPKMRPTGYAATEGEAIGREVITEEVTRDDVYRLLQKIHNSRARPGEDVAASFTAKEKAIFERFAQEESWTQVLENLKRQGPQSVFVDVPIFGEARPGFWTYEMVGTQVPRQPRMGDIFKRIDPATGVPIGESPTETRWPKSDPYSEPIRPPQEPEPIRRGAPQAEAPRAEAPRAEAPPPGQAGGPPAIRVDVDPKPGGGWSYNFNFQEPPKPGAAPTEPPVTKTKMPEAQTGPIDIQYNPPKLLPGVESVTPKGKPKVVKPRAKKVFRDPIYQYIQSEGGVAPGADYSYAELKAVLPFDLIRKDGIPFDVMASNLGENQGNLGLDIGQYAGDYYPADFYRLLERIRHGKSGYIDDSGSKFTPGEESYEQLDDFLIKAIDDGRWKELSPAEQAYARENLPHLKDMRAAAEKPPQPVPKTEAEFEPPPEWDEIFMGEEVEAEMPHAGEAVSPESLKRQKGYEFFAFDTTTNKIRKILGVDAVDTMIRPTEVKLQRNIRTNAVDLLDRGEKASQIALKQIMNNDKVRLMMQMDVVAKGGYRQPDLFGKKVPEWKKDEEKFGPSSPHKPAIAEQPEIPGAEMAEKPPEFPGGYDQRGIRTFKDINTFLPKVQPLIERGYVIEYAHEAGTRGWAKIVGKKPPGEGRLISKSKPPPEFGKPKEEQLKITEKEKKQKPLFDDTYVIPPDKKISHEKKDLNADEQLREDLPKVLKKLKVNKEIWGAVTENVLVNFDPSMGFSLEHYIRGSLGKGPFKKQFSGTWDPETGGRAERHVVEGKTEKVHQLPEWYEPTEKEVLAFGKVDPAPEITAQRKESRKAMNDLIEKKANTPLEHRAATLRLMQPIPYTFQEIANREGVSKNAAKKAFDRFRKRLTKTEDKQLRDWLITDMMYFHSGAPFPSPAQMRAMSEKMRKWFYTTGGLDAEIDAANDERLGGRMAEIFEAHVDAERLDKWIKKNNQEDMRIYIRDILTGDISLDLVQLPDDIRQVLADMRGRIDRLSLMAIDYADFPEETRRIFQHHLGSYLTRKFRLHQEKYWRPKQQYIDRYTEYLRAHYPDTYGDFSEDEMAAYMEGLLQGKKVPAALREHAKKGLRVRSGLTNMRKNVPQVYKDLAGEIVDPVWLYLKTVTEQASMVYNAKFLSEVADHIQHLYVNTLEEAKANGWQNYKLPDETSYGKLKGKYLDPELHWLLTEEAPYLKSGLERGLVKYFMNPFKATRTLGSIPTHARNMLGNVMFSFLMKNTITNPVNLPYYTKAAAVYKYRKSIHKDAYSDMIKHGVTETQFWGAEIPRFYDKLLRLPPETWPDKIYEFAIQRPTESVIDTVGKIYNFEDLIYRMAADIKNREHFGMTPQESVAELNRGMTNYRKLPAVVDFLRTYPWLGPFISFRANVVKILLNQTERSFQEMRAGAGKGPPVDGRGGTGNVDVDLAKHGSLRFLRLMLALGFPMMLSKLSKEITSQLTDTPKEFYKEFEKLLPKWRRHGNFVYIPWGKGVKMVDFTYIWPTGDIERAIKAAIGGDIKNIGDILNVMAHPIFDVNQILFQGKEPGEFGRDLPKRDKWWKTIADRVGKYMAHIWVPQSAPVPDMDALLHGEGFKSGAFTPFQMKTLIDAYWQVPDKYGKTRSLPEEVKGFFTGIRTWNMDPKKTLHQYKQLKAALIKEKDKELQSWWLKHPQATKRQRDNKIAEVKQYRQPLLEDIKKANAFYDKYRSMFKE